MIPTPAPFSVRLIAAVLVSVLLGAGVGLLSARLFPSGERKPSPEIEDLPAEVGERIGGGRPGYGTTERSLFASIELAAIIEREGGQVSADARADQVRRAYAYADLLLELQETRADR